jgi:hypothetical protein
VDFLTFIIRTRHIIGLWAKNIPYTCCPTILYELIEEVVDRARFEIQYELYLFEQIMTLILDQ